MKQRLKYKKKNKGPEDLEITSLLDIIVILLVFLIQNMSYSGAVFKTIKEIKLPVSRSEGSKLEGITLQVSAKQIWAEEELVFDSQGASTLEESFKNKDFIAPLQEWLIKANNLKAEVEGLLDQTKEAPAINIVVDKNLPYALTKKILATCAQSGLYKYNLVVDYKASRN